MRNFKLKKLKAMTDSKITTVEQLQTALSRKPGHSGYSPVADKIDVPISELEPYFRWNDLRHTRISLHDSDEIEAVLTCWEPGQSSAIHNYNFNQGWVLVLQGELYLELYHMKDNRPVEVSEIALRNKGMFYLNDSMGYHRFSNSSPDRTVALFLYVSKVKRWSIYNEKTGQLQTVETTYDHVAGGAH